jgi:hypothetical protein
MAGDPHQLFVVDFSAKTNGKDWYISLLRNTGDQWPVPPDESHSNRIAKYRRRMVDVQEINGIFMTVHHLGCFPGAGYFFAKY